MSGPSGGVRFGGTERGPGGMERGVLQVLSGRQVDTAVMGRSAIFLHDSHLNSSTLDIIPQYSKYLRGIASSSLRNILHIRVYSITSPSSMLSLCQFQLWAHCLVKDEITINIIIIHYSKILKEELVLELYDLF